MPKFSKPKDCQRCPYRYGALSLLDTKDVDHIQDNCLIVNFKKGETICKQNTEVTHALYLAKGFVKLYIEGKNKNLILKLINSGNYIGLQTLFGDKIYRYSVTAVEDSMVCMINSKFLLEMASRNVDYLFNITKEISLSTNYVYKRIIDINQKQLRGRLADSLLYFAETIYKAEEFELRLTRKELAELSSMSMENAVRILGEFKKDGIIEVKGRNIKIVDIEILRKLSEIG